MTLQKAEDLVSPFEEQSVIILILFKLCVTYYVLIYCIYNIFNQCVFMVIIIIIIIIKVIIIIIII